MELNELWVRVCVFFCLSFCRARVGFCSISIVHFHNFVIVIIKYSHLIQDRLIFLNVNNAAITIIFCALYYTLRIWYSHVAWRIWQLFHRMRMSKLISFGITVQKHRARLYVDEMKQKIDNSVKKKQKQIIQRTFHNSFFVIMEIGPKIIKKRIPNHFHRISRFPTTIPERLQNTDGYRWYWNNKTCIYTQPLNK